MSAEMKTTHEEAPRKRGPRVFDKEFTYVQVHQPDIILAEGGRDQVDNMIENGWELANSFVASQGAVIGPNTYYLRKPKAEVDAERKKRTFEYKQMMNRVSGQAQDSREGSTDIKGRVERDQAALTDDEKAALSTAVKAAKSSKDQ